MRISGNFLQEYIQHRFHLLLISLLFFVAGIICGSFYCTSVPQAAAEALSAAVSAQDGAPTVADRVRVFTTSFLNLLQLWVLLSLCGTSCLGVIFAPILVGARGFLCGFTVSAFLILYGMRGVGASAVYVLPQMLLLLPAMQVLCAGAVRHARASVQIADRRLRYKRFWAYCAFCLLWLCVFALVAAYEGYVGWMLVLKLVS